MADGTKKQKDEDIKPNIKDDEVRIIMEKCYGLKGGILNKLCGYDDLNYYYMPSENKNPLIKKLWPHGYVIKIMNSLDSKHDELCEAQNNMMLFLRESKILSPVPTRNLLGQYYIKEKFPIIPPNIKAKKEHIVRLLEFLPGTILKDVTKSDLIFFKVGIFIGKLDVALKKFSHHAFRSHYSIWHLRNMPDIRPFIHFVKDAKKKNLIDLIVNQFLLKVLPVQDSLEMGVIHGDLNENNIIMSKSEDGNWEVSAILDFGDSHISNYLFELAICMCYMMIECKKSNLNILVGMGHLLAGYLTIRPAFWVDYQLLKIAICARLCQSLILGLKSFNSQPDNIYILGSQQVGWSLLEDLWEISVEEITKTWNSILFSYNIKLKN